MASDLQVLQVALHNVQLGAQKLIWAQQRPWRTGTHVWLEGGLPVVDLHDLSIKLARQAVDAVVAEASTLSCGAVLFVTGRGRHSQGAPKLGRAVGASLRRAARERGWHHSPAAIGRQALVMDPKRAPPAATGELGWAFWLGVAVFGVAATIAWPPAGVAVLIALILVAWLGRAGRR